MKALLISDVHSNLTALDVVLDTVTLEVQFEKAEYDVEFVASKLRQRIGDEWPIFEQLANGLRTGGQ